MADTSTSEKMRYMKEFIRQFNEIEEAMEPLSSIVVNSERSTRQTVGFQPKRCVLPSRLTVS